MTLLPIKVWLVCDCDIPTDSCLFVVSIPTLTKNEKLTCYALSTLKGLEEVDGHTFGDATGKAAPPSSRDSCCFCCLVMLPLVCCGKG